MTMPISIVLYALTFLYGIVIGSFLNVCIYRIPKQESIVTVGSHCMNCNHPLAWYDLFPLFSFLFLGGKCRYCKVKLSPQYPIIEATNGVLYVLTFMVLGFHIKTVLTVLLVSTLLVISVIDFRTLTIPPVLNVTILVLAVIYTGVDFVQNGYRLQVLVDHGVGFLAVSVFLFICLLLTKGRGIGGGDIKLMAVAGLYVGWKNSIFALVAGCLLGVLFECIRMAKTKEKGKFAFGPYLSAGIYLSLLVGDIFWRWYLGFLVYSG